MGNFKRSKLTASRVRRIRRGIAMYRMAKIYKLLDSETKAREIINTVIDQSKLVRRAFWRSYAKDIARESFLFGLDMKTKDELLR